MRLTYISILSCSLVAGCGNGNEEPDLLAAGIDQADPSSSVSNFGSNDLQDIPMFPELTEDDFENQIFFDGTGFTDQGLELLGLVKSKSNQAFLNLNNKFAEGTLSEDILECSQFEPGNVLSGFVCNEEVDSVLLDAHGFPLFLISTKNSDQCRSLTLGAFNEQDCEIDAFNFRTDSGFYGYYRSNITSEGIERERLTITNDLIPPFVDPTLLPENCVFELHSDGRVLLSDFESCTTSIDQLLTEFRN